MWDVHSCDRILIPNYWKYPKSSVLHVDCWDDKILYTLPEDIYLFDDSLNWTYILTHETNATGSRYCVFAD